MFFIESVWDSIDPSVQTIRQWMHEWSKIKNRLHRKDLNSRVSSFWSLAKSKIFKYRNIVSEYFFQNLHFFIL